MMKAFASVLCASTLAICSASDLTEIECRQSCLQDLTRALNSRNYFTSEEWIVEALFCDFNGDETVNEALIASPDQRYADGNNWIPIRWLGTGRLVIGTNYCNGARLYSCGESFFSLERIGLKNTIIGKDVAVKKYSQNQKPQSERATVIVSIDDDACLNVSEIACGLDDVVSADDFLSLEALKTEKFKGFDMHPLQANRTNVTQGKSKRERLTFTAAESLRNDNFLNDYRLSVKRLLDIKCNVTVYAIFFDADNDGDVDLYLSSDAEKKKEMSYEWHLYLNKNGMFAKAHSPVVFNADKGFSRESIEPDEVATKDSFYIVQRKYGFRPSVVILDRDGDVVHSRAFSRQIASQPPMPKSRHLSYEERRSYDRALDEWEMEQKIRLGFLPAYDFERLVSRPEFMRLERIPCVSFPEK